LEFSPSSSTSRLQAMDSNHTLGIVAQRFGDGWLVGASPVFGIEPPRQKADAGHPANKVECPLYPPLSPLMLKVITHNLMIVLRKNGFSTEQECPLYSPFFPIPFPHFGGADYESRLFASVIAFLTP